MSRNRPTRGRKNLIERRFILFGAKSTIRAWYKTKLDYQRFINKYTKFMS
jgi:hypothetical protein